MKYYHPYMESTTEIKPAGKAVKKINKKLLAVIAAGLLIAVVITIVVALGLSQSVSFNNLLTPSSYSAQNSNSGNKGTIADPPVSFAQYAAPNPETLTTGEQLVLFNGQIYALDVMNSSAKKLDFIKSGRVENFVLSQDKQWLAYDIMRDEAPQNREVFIYNFTNKTSIALGKGKQLTGGFSTTSKYILIDFKLYDISRGDYLALNKDYYMSGVDWNKDDSAFITRTAVEGGQLFHAYKIVDNKLVNVDLQKIQDKILPLANSESTEKIFTVIGFSGKHILINAEFTQRKGVVSYSYYYGTPSSYTSFEVDTVTTTLYGYDYEADKLIEIKKDIDIDAETDRNVPINANLYYDINHYKVTYHKVNADLIDETITTITLDPSIRLPKYNFTPYVTMPQIVSTSINSNKEKPFGYEPSDMVILNVDSGSLFSFDMYQVDNKHAVYYQNSGTLAHLTGNKFMGIYTKKVSRNSWAAPDADTLPNLKLVIVDIGSGEMQEVKFQ